MPAFYKKESKFSIGVLITLSERGTGSIPTIHSGNTSWNDAMAASRTPCTQIEGRKCGYLSSNQ
jgi:hypothetical protein